jgi:hypothetical protein
VEPGIVRQLPMHREYGLGYVDLVGRESEETICCLDDDRRLSYSCELKRIHYQWGSFGARIRYTLRRYHQSYREVSNRWTYIRLRCHHGARRGKPRPQRRCFALVWQICSLLVSPLIKLQPYLIIYNNGRQQNRERESSEAFRNQATDSLPRLKKSVGRGGPTIKNTVLKRDRTLEKLIIASLATTRSIRRRRAVKAWRAL